MAHFQTPNRPTRFFGLRLEAAEHRSVRSFLCRRPDFTVESRKEVSMEKIIRIFTDGSAIGNPGPGGWGAVVIDGKKRREMSGAYPWTNISEMELLAAVQALRSIPTGSRIELYSDSELLIHGMRGFVFRWQSQGWRNRRGVALQHRDLWLQLLQLDLELHVRWKWLRGHNGHPWQSRADALAYGAARSVAVPERMAA
jgi:ribonuclease HI